VLGRAAPGAPARLAAFPWPSPCPRARPVGPRVRPLGRPGGVPLLRGPAPCPGWRGAARSRPATRRRPAGPAVASGPASAPGSGRVRPAPPALRAPRWPAACGGRMLAAPGAAAAARPRGPAACPVPPLFGFAPPFLCIGAACSSPGPSGPVFSPSRCLPGVRWLCLRFLPCGLCGGFALEFASLLFRVLLPPSVWLLCCVCGWTQRGRCRSEVAHTARSGGVTVS